MIFDKILEELQELCIVAIVTIIILIACEITQYINKNNAADVVTETEEVFIQHPLSEREG